jgi:hypothetical protein
MHKDPSLNKVKYSLRQLEVQLLMEGIKFAKSDESNEQCARMETVVNEAMLQAQNIILKALKIIKTPELLAIFPTSSAKPNN